MTATVKVPIVTSTMSSGIEIHQDIVDGLVAELQRPQMLDQTHHLARENNPLLHLLHGTIISTLKRSSNYDDDIIDAVEVGAKAYEALSIAVTDPVPTSFAVNVVSEREKDSNFGLVMAEQIGEARERLLDTNHHLALGIYAVCAAHVSRPELASSYSVGGAALLQSAHQEVYDFWRLENSLWPDGDMSL